jgi:hypothetical protein
VRVVPTRTLYGTNVCFWLVYTDLHKYCYGLLSDLLNPFVQQTHLTECSQWTRIIEFLFHAESLEKK